MAYSIHEFVGTVSDIPAKKRAIVEFYTSPSAVESERALLFYDKLIVSGQAVPQGGRLKDYISVGTTLRIHCHTFDASGTDRCSWYIVKAWPEIRSQVIREPYIRLAYGLYNCTGTILKVNKRQGFLTNAENLNKEPIVFLASHIYILGKRLSSKANLQDLVIFQPGQTLQFDAVPHDPDDVKGPCKWFATVVWKGVKPQMEYDLPWPAPRNISQLDVIKRITNDPKSMFLFSHGPITQILDSEYAIALGRFGPNHYDFVLFHRSAVDLFGYCLSNTDLRTVFEEKDYVRFKAAALPLGWNGPRWVASRVTVFVGPCGKAMEQQLLTGNSLQPEHSLMGNGLQPEHSMMGNGFQPQDSLMGNGFQPQHSLMGNGFQPEHSMMGNGFQPQDSLMGNGFQPQHSLMGNGFQPQHSLMGNGFQPQHSLMGNGLQPEHSLMDNGLQPEQLLMDNGLQPEQLLLDNGLQPQDSLMDNGLQQEHSLMDNNLQPEDSLMDNNLQPEDSLMDNGLQQEQ